MTAAELPVIEALLTTYVVDRAHARAVTEHALQLFDVLQPLTGLPAAARELLEAAALLHNLGLAVNPAQHQIVGRDILLTADLPYETTAALALLIVLHRKRPRPQLEPAYWAVRPRDRAWLLQLAAILRVADGLDVSQTQTTRLTAQLAADRLQLQLSGPHAQQDGERALQKAADLWAATLPLPLEVLANDDGQAAAVAAAPVGEEAADALSSAAARAAFQQHSAVPAADWLRRGLADALARLLQARRAVLRDNDADAVHALRVACRRARSLLTLAEGVHPTARPAQINRALRSLARAAAAVRDREVAVAELTAADQIALEPLISTLNDEMVTARRALVRSLRSTDLERSLQRFARLIFRRDAWPQAPQLRNRLGSVLYAHYEQLRELDGNGAVQDISGLHALRLAVKRMRYQLEWWETLPDIATARVLKPLMQLQELLGRSNDLAVLNELLTPHAALQTAELDSYLSSRRSTAAAQAAEATAVRRRLLSPAYRRLLTGLIGRL
jgi:CHAD domain-containing protein